MCCFAVTPMTILLCGVTQVQSRIWCLCVALCSLASTMLGAPQLPKCVVTPQRHPRIQLNTFTCHCFYATSSCLLMQNTCLGSEMLLSRSSCACDQHTVFMLTSPNPVCRARDVREPPRVKKRLTHPGQSYAVGISSRRVNFTVSFAGWPAHSN